MNTHKWYVIKFVLIILALLLGQSLNFVQEASGASAREYSGAAEMAEYQSYLPLLIRQVFVESKGELDPSFGEGGIVNVQWGSAQAVVWQADNLQGGAGKIVVASTNLVSRFLADGSLDASFGEEGSTVVEVWGPDIELQEDGKILVAGYDYMAEATDFALARINPDGSLDTSFSEDGLLTTDFFGDYDYGRSLVLQPDGKIILGGYAEDPDTYDEYFALARYNPDGSLDATFGDSGKVLTDLGLGELQALALQPAGQGGDSGKIVAAGYIFNGQDTDFALVRYNPDGSLDTSFDGDGWLATDFFAQDAQAFDVAWQMDGKILVAGMAIVPDRSSDIALVRYNFDGSLDSSFGEGGMVFTHLSGYGEIGCCLVLQPDGKIIVGGYVDVAIVDPMNPESDFVLARYMTDGSLDPSFGNAGWLTTDVDSRDDVAYALMLQPDGRIVLGGESDQYLALVRYK